jgi:hypothetical protein
MSLLWVWKNNQIQLNLKAILWFFLNPTLMYWSSSKSFGKCYYLALSDPINLQALYDYLAEKYRIIVLVLIVKVLIKHIGGHHYPRIWLSAAYIIVYKIRYPRILLYLMAIWTMCCQNSGPSLFAVLVFAWYSENVTPAYKEVRLYCDVF